MLVQNKVNLVTKMEYRLRLIFCFFYFYIEIKEQKFVKALKKCSIYDMNRINKIYFELFINSQQLEEKR